MNNKIKQTVILSFIFCFTCTYPLKAQENKLFMEYISCFTEKHFTDTFVNCDTIGNKPYVSIKSDYLKFLDKNMQDTTMTTWIVYKVDNEYYLTLLSQQVDSTSSYNYYFVFYNQMGDIINSYTDLASIDDEYDTKLLISKMGIKYFLYGPHTKQEKTNCKEVFYEIVNNDSLKKVSEQNYEVERKDLFTW